MERQRIKENLDKILNGELEVEFVPTLRKHIKDNNLIGKYECKECKCKNIWNNKPIELDLDHIDGNKRNNRRENLRWLCPNCHSQTKNWKIKNVKKVRKPNVKTQNIINCIKEGGDISDILRRLNPRPGGDNYRRITNIIRHYKLNTGSDVRATGNDCKS